MPYRMSRTLKLEVEIECKQRNGFMFKDRDVAPILLEMERAGDAMRCLNKRGQLIWRLTPERKAELAHEKKDCQREQHYARQNRRPHPGMDWEI